MTSTSTSTTSRATSSSTTSNQPPAEVYILFIVAPTFGLPGTGDLLYELDLSSNGKREDSPHLAQFIASSSLDELDAQLLLQQQAVNTPGQLFFKSVDSFNDFLVSAFVTPGHLRLLLLHKSRATTAASANLEPNVIKPLLEQVSEVFTKTVLTNPFYVPFRKITSNSLKLLLDTRVKNCARRYLTHLT